MSEIANQIENLIDRRLDRLLLIEKERRGIPANDLVFIGMANIADLYWCGMQSILRSRRDEKMYFASYLYDRLLYSYALGLIDKLPRQSKRLLEIGNEITQEQVERLLRRIPQRKAAKRIELEKVRNELQKLNWKERGVEAERLLSESYRSIRWNFEWGKYVVVGVPDGITDRYVYEFKTTGRLRYVTSNQTKAFTQADLYGYFFNRPSKRVQLCILENARIETWEEAVDIKNALSTLEYFNKIDSGLLPSAPEAFKCRICEFANECPILHNKAWHV